MLDKQTRLALLEEMYYIRLVEEEIAARYPREQMRCPVHLSIGQEGVPAGFALSVRDTDFAVSTHRGHAHYLAKGGNLGAMIAEIYGKSTGCSRGKGGSMHLIDLAVRFMGSTAIVGNSIPIGVGLGLSSQLHAEDNVSCIFLGDGAVEEGVFFESLNFAAVKKLPVLFICENNFYSVYSPFRVRQPEGRSIARMVEAFGVKSFQADGNDVEMVFQTLTSAFREIRSDGGPVFVEFSTYRWREHCGPSFDDDLGYRSDEEVAYWKQRDPIKLLSDKLSSEVSDFDLVADVLISKLKVKIEAAFKFAEDSPFPDPSEAFIGVYSNA
jgi:TPP-dependent pyruvate/acetoin dehydrogenase alpha subunit